MFTRGFFAWGYDSPHISENSPSESIGEVLPASQKGEGYEEWYAYAGPNVVGDVNVYREVVGRD